MDHSKLLMVRGALHARRSEWPDAEMNFRDALTIAEGEPAVDASYVLKLLTSFTEALKVRTTIGKRLGKWKHGRLPFESQVPGWTAS